jgi:hypothetical protein
MKLAAIAKRGLRRDFWDLHAILIARDVPLGATLDDYVAKYRVAEADLYHVLRSLTYFEDAERDAFLPAGLSEADWKAIKTFFQREAPKALSARYKGAGAHDYVGWKLLPPLLRQLELMLLALHELHQLALEAVLRGDAGILGAGKGTQIHDRVQDLAEAASLEGESKREASGVASLAPTCTELEGAGFRSRAGSAVSATCVGIREQQNMSARTSRGGGIGRNTPMC